MMNHNSKAFSYPQSEKGQAILIIALMFIILLGFAALAIDGARIYAERRTLQNVTDAAVLSAALKKCSNGNVTAAARAIAAANGYNNDGVQNTIVVNSPPLSGANAGNAKYVEVILTAQVTPGFAVFFHPDNFEVSARSVSHCFASSNDPNTNPYKNAIVSTNPHDCSAVLMGGNGNITVNGSGVFVNSDCTGGNPAVKLSGNGSLIADPVNIVGGYKQGGGGKITGTVSHPGPITTIWDVPAPPKPAGSCTDFKAGSKDVTLDPGLYCGMNISSGGSVTLNPGIYYILSGGFKMSGDGNVTGSGVLIYIDGGSFSVTANGNFNLSAPTSGDYKGLALYVVDPKKNLVDLSGNGNMMVTGTIFAPLSRVKITGNGSNTTFNAQIVSDTLEVGGNGNITINYDPNLNYNWPAPATISLDE